MIIIDCFETERTLNGNSGEGTDHGWSGHSFILGGSLDGGKILGQYPDGLDDGSKYNAGRGRLIPTMPYEAPWNAVAQWLGVDEDNFLDLILPNRMSFPGQLFEKEDIYAISDNDYKRCETDESPITCKPKSIVEEDFETSIDSSGDTGTNSSDGVEEKAKTSSAAIIAPIVSTIALLLLIFGVYYKMRCRRDGSLPAHRYGSDESVQSLFKSTNLVQFMGNEEIEVDITYTYSDSDSSTGSP